VLDKRQLAYKVTANSLYGQCGAKTSAFYEQDAAASTTATGRLLLTYAKTVVEECYGDKVCETDKYGPVCTKAEYIYGDTDSVFFTFHLTTPEGEKIVGEKALEISIEIAKEATHLVSQFLKEPHDFEYEKTFSPFCLLSKKRYVGMLYEHDYKKGKRKEMGICLKRRDSAPIVKDIYGGVIDIFMKEQNLQKAINFLKKCLQEIVDENVSMDKLIITKSLSSFYKNPKQIAHKVLADRITARDPGNKPKSGDRIPFIYVVGAKKDLQGNKIETPSFIAENHVKIDYPFYITNQIMKPLLQLFGLVLEEMWSLKKMRGKINHFKEDVTRLKATTPEDKFQDKLDKLKDKEVKTLLFDDYLRETNNAKNGNKALTSFFAPATTSKK
jgi:DNA polymerase elongation subunit (family B)